MGEGGGREGVEGPGTACWSGEGGEDWEGGAGCLYSCSSWYSELYGKQNLEQNLKLSHKPIQVGSSLSLENHLQSWERWCHSIIPVIM